MIQITSNRDEFRAEFQKKIETAKRPRAMLAACGRELGNQLRTHFRKRDQNNPNHLSDRRSHFWNAVARSVQSPVVNESNRSVSVTVSDPRFAQKVFGGPIIAKAAKALTMPVAPDAYGRSAATFERETGLKLFIVRIGGGKNNAFENAVLAASRDGKLEVEYLLTPRVDQEKDPDALPPMTVLETAILARADSVLQHEIQQA